MPVTLSARARPSSSPLLGLIALGSLAAVGAALVAQHAFGVKPCPWCVMQRGVFLLLALAAGLGWLLGRWRVLRRGASLLSLALAGAGLAAAYYQHEVASKLASCDMTLADRILIALDLEARWPSMFMVTASCSEATAYTLLGLPYEIWSALSFALMGLLAILAWRRG
ncbi:disulfide bond formation protein B [Pelomonas sp. CA6]|uniref:disulfide bond formation protein B n=1 Tax=Pelomonas sp. CA6 TaxID=2907999 RepID=UPI001F4A5CC3|nr:disulfide bond formation protein B [Pelomonas sp. CA6]MCH7342297.1 disulfide bond formation protein B [Pelomonas sp. CA6]